MQKVADKKWNEKDKKKELLLPFFLYPRFYYFFFGQIAFLICAIKKNTAQKMLPSIVMNLDKSVRFIEIMASITI